MELKIFWTEFSQKELKNIYDYYLEKAGHQIAKKIVDGIYKDFKAKKTPRNWSK